MMPSVHGQYLNPRMEDNALEHVDSKQTVAESSVFICTECGDGFNQYPEILTHMALHGPLESFPLDGSSNGFEFPQEYVLQENGTLTMIHGIDQSHYNSIRSTSGTKSAVLSTKSPTLLSPSPTIISPSPTLTIISPTPTRISPTIPSHPSPHQDVSWTRPTAANLGQSNQGNHRCEICCKLFNSQLDLHRHKQYQNTERGYKCTLCCQNFESREGLKKHLQEHAHNRFYCCGLCGKRFLKAGALNAHHKEYHTSPKPKTFVKSENYEDKKVERTYACKKCRADFFWLSDFQAHSLYHCKGLSAPFIPEDPIHFKNQEDAPREIGQSNGMSIDLKTLDGKTLQVPGGVSESTYSTPYRCGLCGERFNILASLKQHHLIHQTQEERDQLNQEVQGTFRRRRKMSHKIQIRTRGRRGRPRNWGQPQAKLHACKQCNRVFNHSSSLSRHMRYHKGTLHTCVFCGRHFPQRCDVRRHIGMYHKAELEKKTELKQIALKTLPQAGSEEHSFGEGKYKSSFDSQSVSAKQEKKGRQAAKLLSKARGTYKCQDCGKKFGLLCVYQRHLRYHKKEPSENLRCPQCPAHFRNSSTLERHIESHASTQLVNVVPTTAGTAKQKSVLQKDHAVDIENDDVDNKDNNTEVLYDCTECTETFSSLQIFLQHQNSHSSENLE